MSRPRLRSVSALGVLLALPGWTAPQGSSPSVAARVDREPISIAAIDAPSAEEVRRIRARLSDTALRAVQDLIDRRLGIEASSESALVKLTLPPSEALESELPPDLIVALIGGAAIRAQALEDAAALRLYRLRGELYLQRRRHLDTLIERHLLKLEARSRGMSLEELEAELSGSAPVTDAEIAEFVSRERAAGRPVEDPQRVRPYLEFQKKYRRRSSVLEARRARTQVDIYLRAPERPRLAMETDGGVALGRVSGPVIVAYTNYACASCRATHLEIDRLLADTQAPPRIILRDFANDPIAMEAAALVRCAARNARGAAMRRVLLRDDPPSVGQPWFTAEKVPSLAGVAGMSPSELRRCKDSPEIRAWIERDTRSAQRLGFDEPPAFVAAGVPLSGMQSAQSLRGALLEGSDAELSAHK